MCNGKLSLLIFGVLVLLLAGCAGGSGSSGFDIRALENERIEQALDEQRCVDVDGLQICPSAEGAMEPPASPTPLDGPPTPTPRIPESPSPTPPDGTALPTTTPTPTASPTPPGAARVEVVFESAEAIACLQPSPEASCQFHLSFSAPGFDPDTSFRVAVRNADPPGDWVIGDDPSFLGNGHAPAFSTNLQLDPGVDGTADFLLVQFAVLVFDEVPFDLPASVQRLGETGARLAFVSEPIRARSEIRAD